ncbi:unnamed protein product [Cylicostephanus goldi]|uniref:Uncharacterized protein n=1 Tax=Cylicostephanus goldi TaxID=71465 RepID=A0A3P7QFB5_CYLGO|nr:unnamed protein product [Cylicostephanus goldi]
MLGTTAFSAGAATLSSTFSTDFTDFFEGVRFGALLSDWEASSLDEPALSSSWVVDLLDGERSEVLLERKLPRNEPDERLFA